MGKPSNDRTIARFTMLGHASVHWFETAIPIFLVVWIADLDVSLAVIGLVVAMGYAPFGLGAVPAGVIADRYGERALILLCLGGMGAGFLVVAAVASVWTIGVGLLIWGIAASLYHPAGLSLISTGVTDRGTVFAWHGMAGNFGIALGPFAAAVLLLVLDWQLVAALMAAPCLIGIIYGLRADFDPTAGVDHDLDGPTDTFSWATFRQDTRVLFASSFAVVFVLVTFEGLYYRGMLTYLPEILHGLPAFSPVEGDVGLAGIEPADFIYVGILVIGMAGQYAGGKAIGRVTPERGLLGSFLVLAILALAFVPAAAAGALSLLVLCGLLGFFLFAIQPFYQEAVAVHTPPEGRGLSYGYTYLGEFGLGSASVVVGGLVLGRFELVAFFAVLAGFAVVGALLGAVLGRGGDTF